MTIAPASSYDPAMSELIRLNKLMAKRGLCSRREADDLIFKGLVKVNGKTWTNPGEKVPADCHIDLAWEGKKALEAKVTILINKPVGYVSGLAEDGYTPAVRLISNETKWEKERGLLKPEHLDGIAPAGRLDIDSQGLLVLTQDGVVAKSLIGENSGIEKEYLVRVRGELSDKGLNLLREGLELDGKRLKRAQVDWINEDQLKFILREGKKRQIRRMCELVGLQVVGLKRVRVGKVKLGDLPEGQWRFLKNGEQF